MQNVGALVHASLRKEPASPKADSATPLERSVKKVGDALASVKAIMDKRSGKTVTFRSTTAIQDTQAINRKLHDLTATVDTHGTADQMIQKMAMFHVAVHSLYANDRNLNESLFYHAVHKAIPQKSYMHFEINSQLTAESLEPLLRKMESEYQAAAILDPVQAGEKLTKQFKKLENLKLLSPEKQDEVLQNLSGQPLDAIFQAMAERFKTSSESLAGNAELLKNQLKSLEKLEILTNARKAQFFHSLSGEPLNVVLDAIKAKFEAAPVSDLAVSANALKEQLRVLENLQILSQNRRTEFLNELADGPLNMDAILRNAAVKYRAEGGQNPSIAAQSLEQRLDTFQRMGILTAKKRVEFLENLFNRKQLTESILNEIRRNPTKTIQIMTDALKPFPSDPTMRQEIIDRLTERRRAVKGTVRKLAGAGMVAAAAYTLGPVALRVARNVPSHATSMRDFAAPIIKTIPSFVQMGVEYVRNLRSELPTVTTSGVLHRAKTGQAVLGKAGQRLVKAAKTAANNDSFRTYASLALLVGGLSYAAYNEYLLRQLKKRVEAESAASGG